MNSIKFRSLLVNYIDRFLIVFTVVGAIQVVLFSLYGDLSYGVKYKAMVFIIFTVILLTIIPVVSTVNKLLRYLKGVRSVVYNRERRRKTLTDCAAVLFSCAASIQLLSVMNKADSWACLISVIMFTLSAIYLADALSDYVSDV